MTNRYAIPAVFFLSLQLLLLIVLLPDPSTRDVVVWYCNSVPLFLGLAFLSGRMQVVKGIIDVGILAQLLWVADLLARAMFNTPLFHITDYVFASGLSAQNIVTVIVHVTTPLMALGWSYRVVPRRISLAYSCVYIVALYVATVAFTPAADNINYVFHGADLQGLVRPLDPLLSSHAYIFLWPLGMMLLAGIGYGIQTLLYRLAAAPARKT